MVHTIQGMDYPSQLPADSLGFRTYVQGEALVGRGLVETSRTVRKDTEHGSDLMYTHEKLRLLRRLRAAEVVDSKAERLEREKQKELNKQVRLTRITACVIQNCVSGAYRTHGPAAPNTGASS
jgi:hypothetical protein